MGDGSEPIDDDELLYRRIPVLSGWYSPETGLISPEAFAPHKTEDATGLSISRGKYKSAEEASRGRIGKSYFVAILRASSVRAFGIQIVPRPRPDDPGHAEMPDLNASNLRDNMTVERKVILANLCLRVEGPFKWDG